jgi:hypothetical protein
MLRHSHWGHDNHHAKVVRPSSGTHGQGHAVVEVVTLRFLGAKGLAVRVRVRAASVERMEVAGYGTCSEPSPRAQTDADN